MNEVTDPLALSQAEVEALDEAAAQAVLEVWVRARRIELPQALARSTSKVHARLAKKALYQLKSAKVEVPPEAPPASAPAAVSPAGAAEDLPAILSAVLGTGERAIFFAVPVRGGGLDVYQGILHDERGILHFAAGASRRGTYRERLKELKADRTTPVLFVPLERARLELGRAVAVAERSGTALPQEAQAALLKLQIEKVDPDWPLPPLEPEDGGRARQGGALHREPELEGWYPSEEAITALGHRLNEVEASPLALSEAQRAEQVQLKVDATVAEYLTPPRRAVYARRLWLTAELLEASERGEAAETARAAARELFHGSGPSRFVEGMFQKVVLQRSQAAAAAAAGVAPGSGPDRSTGRLPAPPPSLIIP